MNFKQNLLISTITKESNMDFECIIYEKEKGIATIKLHRPKVLNAMNKQLWLDFQAALDDVKNDSEIKVAGCGTGWVAGRP